MRPCIVFGPNVDNYLVRLWTKQPFAVDAGNLDGHIQFVHEDDVVEAVSGLLLGRHAGQFNLAPDGLMTLRECAELLETPVPQDAGAALPGDREGVCGGCACPRRRPARSTSRSTRGSSRTRR